MQGHQQGLSSILSLWWTCNIYLCRLSNSVGLGWAGMGGCSIVILQISHREGVIYSATIDRFDAAVIFSTKRLQRGCCLRVQWAVAVVEVKGNLIYLWKYCKKEDQRWRNTLSLKRILKCAKMQILSIDIFLPWNEVVKVEVGTRNGVGVIVMETHLQEPCIVWRLMILYKSHWELYRYDSLNFDVHLVETRFRFKKIIFWFRIEKECNKSVRLMEARANTESMHILSTFSVDNMWEYDVRDPGTNISIVIRIVIQN